MTSNVRNNPLDRLPTCNIPRRRLEKTDPLSFGQIANGCMTGTNFVALPNNYTFEIRCRGCSAIANGKISNTTGDLKATLHDFLGHNILEIRKVRHFMKILRHPFSFFRRSNELMDNVNRFDVHEGGKRIGQIVYGIREPTETCLKIFHADNNTQLVVRSLRMGEFSVFRDESSPSPLCIIQSNPLELDVHSSNDFRSNMEFYSEAKITVEEEKLCTGAAFVNKICEVQRSQYFANQLLEEKANANRQKKSVLLKILYDFEE